MTRLAAIDVGTNSTRLLVAGPGDPLVVVERQMRITRLGQGVDAAGRLDDEALERTLACIEDYAATAQRLGASRLRVGATSAVRDAADRERFFAGVRARAGVDAEVLTGQAEAAAAFLGATASVDGRPPFCVLDIGGGSTELIVGSSEPEASTSRQLGCVRLTERALHGDPPAASEIGAALALIDRELEVAAADVDPARARTLVGVAGTVTTLGALFLDLPAYVPSEIHGVHVPLEGVRDLTRRLARMPAAERAALGPMTPGREDVILGGAMILERTMERFSFDEVLVSEADALDGLVLQMLAAGVSAPARAARPRA
jgi:exopolyphosphatase/guanosine-5'-triphosphate,3'-diphosphate pyrophosphatase